MRAASELLRQRESALELVQDSGKLKYVLIIFCVVIFVLTRCSIIFALMLVTLCAATIPVAWVLFRGVIS